MKKQDTLRNNKKFDRAHAPSAPMREPCALPENLVIGRNAVRELLESGRAIDKIYTARGDRDGSITTLVHTAIERKIPVMEADRRKLDELSLGERHQGIIAYALEKESSTVAEMIRLAEENGEARFLVIRDGI
jgi:23S rRNA (guanosine2251-2'-O)-methyltransferase